MRASLRCPSCGYDLCGQVAALELAPARAGGVCAECGTAFRLAVEAAARARAPGKSRVIGVLVFLNALSLSVYVAGGDALAVVVMRSLPLSVSVVVGALGLVLAAFGGGACRRALVEMARPSGRRVRAREAAGVLRASARASMACGLVVSAVCLSGFELWSSASMGAGQAAAACVVPALTGASLGLIAAAAGRAVGQRAGGARRGGGRGVRRVAVRLAA